MEYYFSNKKNELFVSATTWMNLKSYAASKRLREGKEERGTGEILYNLIYIKF